MVEPVAGGRTFLVWARLQAWLGRGKQAGWRPHTLEFDAVVDLDPAAVPAGVEAEAARSAVAQTLRSMPGARRVTARVRNTETSILVRVFPAGAGVERPGEVWDRLRADVSMRIQSALLGLEPSAPPAETRFVPAAAIPGLLEAQAGPMGFAEAPGISDLNALADLAALAQSVSSAQSLSLTGIEMGAPAWSRPKTGSPAKAEVELMSRLLGFVLPGDIGATAGAAVSRFGSFAAVLAAPESELRRVPGLGQHSVAAIKLVHEAAIRLSRARVSKQPVLDDPARLTAYLAAALGRERVEQFRILFLDDRGVLKADEVQAKGTVNHTPVYPREVVRRALELGASALVLVHNHPSGDPTPSRDDIEMTKLIRDGAGALSITVRDHIIVGNGRSLSFREEGLLT